MPTTFTTSWYSLETVVFLNLTAIAVCSSTLLQIPYYRHLWEENAPISGLTIFYTSGFPAIGIPPADFCRPLPPALGHWDAWGGAQVWEQLPL